MRNPFKKQEEKPLEKAKRSVLRKLRGTTSSEVLRWGDNLVSAIGKNLQETQKSLNHNDQAQALMSLEDMRTCAVSLLAVIQVVEERLTQI